MERREVVLGLRNRMLEMARMDDATLDVVLLDELHTLLTAIRAASPWWREHLPELASRGHYTSTAQLLQQLPVLTRDALQVVGRDMRIRLPHTDNAEYMLHVTSGSTRQPREVLKHRATYELFYDATTLVEWDWQRRDVRRRLVTFRVNHEDNDHEDPGEVLRYIGFTSDLPTRNFRDHSPEELLDAVAELQPAYLFCSGHVLQRMAHEQLRRPRPIQGLEQVLSVADRVDSSVRQLIHDAFGARVCDRYSAEEIGYIALQCPQDDHMHVVAPNVLMEIVDDAGQPCVAGQPGHVLLTSLRDDVQPLIRYDLGDIAEWDDHCTAGITWPAIAAVHGRSRQMGMDASGRMRLATFVDAEFLTMRDLLDYQALLFDDAVVFIAHTEMPISEERHGIIERSVRKALHTELPFHLVFSPEPIWEAGNKLLEFDFVPGNFDPAQSLEELLARRTRSSVR